MGYFTRPIRRAAARQTVRTTLAQTRLCGASADFAPQRPRLYLRFSAGELHPDSLRQRGVFHTSHALHEPGRLTEGAWELLRESDRWFSEHLVAPALNEGRAIFWFRADAADCLRRIWDRVTVLRDSGIPVCMLRCTDPGLIVYRDELQVAAVPQRRVRWRQRML